MDHPTPPYAPIYSLSEVEQLAPREFLDENLNNQLTRPSQSSTGPPVSFIRKDGSLRLAVDDRGLSKITTKDRYPHPLIPDLVNHLHSTRIFSKLDLRGAYNLVSIADGDE